MGIHVQCRWGCAHCMGISKWLHSPVWPKERASFHSQRWNSDTKPDLAFAHTVDTGIPTRRVLDKFPRSQHRPSLISSPCFTAPIACKPVKRWNFRKGNCETFKQMTDVAISQLPPPDTADTEDAYKAFCRILTNNNIRYHVDITRTRSRAGMMNVNNHKKNKSTQRTQSMHLLQLHYSMF